MRYLFLIVVMNFAFAAGLVSQPLMEKIGRGVVAVKSENGVFIGWRLLGSDIENTGFNVYKILDNKSYKINNEVIYNKTNYIDSSNNIIDNCRYCISTVINNHEVDFSDSVYIWKDQYISVPLKKIERYRPGDASVGDLDGDGQYEIVVHMTGRSHDNSHLGITSEPVLQAYELNGEFLWEINFGKNIREGAHYTQFIVYDLDGDGKAEVACKTADGTIDGTGKVIGNKDSVYVKGEDDSFKVMRRNGEIRNIGLEGLIISGPEYLTVFEGATGKALSTVPYFPPRHPETLYPGYEQMRAVWGDGRGNRIDRFLACAAYLDSEHASLVMCRGYYTRSVLVAWDFIDGRLKHRWTFDSEDGTPGNEKYSGQGNHNLSVGDVDNDGKDEIIYGSCVIDDNGKGLYSTGFGHGDAMHFSDLDPQNEGLEIFNIQERFDDAGMNFREAGSGKVLWKIPSVKAAEEGGDKGEGPGRGVAFNVDPRYMGSECWARGAGMSGIYNSKGDKICEKTPRSCNFAIWWDGDLLRELLDRNWIGKWNWKTETIDTLFIAEGCRSINGSKATPVLSADIFGDWREEVIFRSDDNSEIRIYTTVIPCEYKFYTLMHDPVYRLGIAWQNVGYNQPPHTSFYIGNENYKLIKPKIRFVE